MFERKVYMSVRQKLVRLSDALSWDLQEPVEPFPTLAV